MALTTDAIMTFFKSEAVHDDVKPLLGDDAKNMEFQVIAGERKIRVPYNGDTDPEYRDRELDILLEEEADLIGFSGWDWLNRTSLWVGFDFDTIAGHAEGVGIDDKELERVREKAAGLPWVAIHHSKGGKGFHILVQFENPPRTETRKVHKTLAAVVLKHMGELVGYAFDENVDHLGEILWLYAKNHAPNGFECIKRATEKLNMRELPSNWRDYSIERRARPTRNCVRSFSPEHDDHCTWLDSEGWACVVDHDTNRTPFVKTHSAGLKALKAAKELTGGYDTNCVASDPATPNGFMYPLEDGSWRFMYYGGTRDETENWKTSANGRLWTLLNESEEQSSQRRVDNLNRALELSTRDEFFQYDDVAYVTADNGLTYTATSHMYKLFVRRRFREEYGESLRNHDLSDYIAEVEGEALAGEVIAVHKRYAHEDGSIYIDLCDDSLRAVHITPEGWSIINPPPVKFLRFPGMAALPTPSRDGSLDDLLKIINVSEDDAVLVKAWLVGTYSPYGAKAILAIYASGGSGKTWLMKRIRDCIDPNSADVTMSPRNIQDMVIAARQNAVLAYDNVSTMNHTMLDAVCGFATGTSIQYRALFENDELVRFQARLPQMFSGVAPFTAREDVLTRFLTINPPEIKQNEHKSERQLADEFAELQPGILGALYDHLSAGLRNLDSVKSYASTRLADFAQWAAACGIEDFEEVYSHNQREAAQLICDSDPWTAALVAFIREEVTWEGTLEELRMTLNSRCFNGDERGENWPTSARKVSSLLASSRNALKTHGVVYERLSKNRNGVPHLFEFVGDANG